MLNAYASESHYIDHIAPIWQNLSPAIKGTFHTTESQASYATRLGIKTETTPPNNNHTIVASWGDYKKTTGPVIYMEHGIGHTYSNNHPSYAGSPGKDRVTLFLNQHIVTDTKNRATYPNANHAIIGVPKMDQIKQRPPQDSVVCLSFHWDARVAPESRSAFRHYRRFIGDINKIEGINLIGHCHPRKGWRETVEPYYTANNIEFVPTFAEVLARADFYIIDNSSTGYEFAAAGRPVIHMNAPWYRKTINHGIRFWDHIPGPTVENGLQLIRTIPSFITGFETYEPQRKKVVKTLFPHLGNATQVAVKAIENHLS